jgi:hypothetical protein
MSSPRCSGDSFFSEETDRAPIGAMNFRTPLSRDRAFRFPLSPVRRWPIAIAHPSNAETVPAHNGRSTIPGRHLSTNKLAGIVAWLPFNPIP